MSSVEVPAISFVSDDSGFFGSTGDSSLVPVAITPGTYGTATDLAQITVNASGQITAISTVPFGLNLARHVCWSDTVGGAEVAGTDITFDLVLADSGDIIDEAVAGDTMTITNSGLYWCWGQIDGSTTNLRGGFAVNGVAGRVFLRSEGTSSMTPGGFQVLSLNAGDTISLRPSSNFTSTAYRQNIFLIRLS